MATNSKFIADIGIKTDSDLQIGGNTTIDGNATVSGNLTVNGTSTTINATTTSVEDNMLELANANTSSDTLDIGIYGNYDDGLSDGGATEYTGLFRDASDSTWKLFDGLEVAPTTTVNTSGTGYTLADLTVGDLTATTLTATNGLTGSSITYPTSDGTNGQVIKTDGSGTLTFGDIPAGYTDSDVETYLNTSEIYTDATNNRLGIGTSSPETFFHIKTTSPTISMTDTNSFADTNDRFQIRANADVGQFQWYDDSASSTTTLMTLTPSGNLLVGNTDSTPYDRTSGNAIALGDGLISSAQEGGNAAIFNRMTNDGSIVGFRKDGTEVGSIGANSGDIYIASTGTYSAGLMFEGSSGAQDIRPCSSTGALLDGAVDLGDSSARFKDLHLSGTAGIGNVVPNTQGTYSINHLGVYSNGITVNAATSQTGYLMSAGTGIVAFSPSGGSIKLGGTAAANQLDDYEEGTHTATITCSVSGTVSLYSNINKLNYVKNGKIVHIQGMLTAESVSSPSGYFTVSLPFNISSWGGTYAGRGTGTIWLNTGSSNNVADYVVLLVQGESRARVYLGDNIGVQSDSANNIGANDDIYVGLTYISN